MGNDAILEFTGEYHFLSNFEPCTFVWDGITWPSSEHAYVAAKTLDQDYKLIISKISTPTEVKRLGRSKLITIRPDWENEELRCNFMLEITWAKFSQIQTFGDRMLATGERELQEGNSWNDTFWGICPVGSGLGKNNLGKVLMKNRTRLRIERG